jgi:hypothetical protein
MMKFCPSCGGIVEIPAGMHLMNMHDRLCHCAQPAEAVESVQPATLTEEQVRAIVREEVVKALANVKQEAAQDALDGGKPEVVHEAPVEIVKHARAKRGTQKDK